MIQKRTDKIVQGWESPVAIHPGEFLKDILEECSMSQVELAQRMDIDKKTVNDIVVGKISLTMPNAYKLSKIFDLSAEYWINLQKIYENDKARLEEEKKIEKEAKEFLPLFQETYKELAHYGLVESMTWIRSNYDKIVLELQKYYGVDSLGLLNSKFTFAAAFRKYDRKKINNYSLAAWLRLGQIEAQKTAVAAFDKKKLQDNLEKIRALSKNNPDAYLPEIKEMLADVGIVVVYAPAFKNTHAQGATEWVDKDKAYIILKTTKQGEDRLWFNLFHELCHVLKEHSKRDTLINIEDASGDRAIEREADEFAQNKLIPDFDKKVGKYAGKSLENMIDSMARDEGISPSIVAGRIAYECKEHKEAWKMTGGLIRRIDYTNLTI